MPKMDGLYLFVLTLFNEGAYLTSKSIFHKALKDGIIVFCYFEKEPVLPF